MFDSTKEDLRDILREIDQGKLQLPDFQRDYVWAESDVKSLLASVGKGFPVGALLTLETGGAVQFKPRLLEGVEPKDVQPTSLLLDGQQRMTSLYQTTFSKRAIRTRTVKGTEVDRFYYFDIKKAIDDSADIEDAIVGVPADKILRSNFGKTIELDLSEREHEYEQDFFPINLAFDSKDWFFGWRDFWRDRPETIDLERAFDSKVLDCIQRYKMPLIKLDKDNSREAICLVFEKVNVGGKKLDAFELVTAMYAASNFDLRKDWSGTPRTADTGRRGRIIGYPPRDVLSEIASTDILQACTLLHTRQNRLRKYDEGLRDRELPQVSVNRDALLGLPLSGFLEHADAVEAGFIEAGAFLNQLKIIWHKDVPYPPLIVGLAATYAIMGREAKTVAAEQKLEQWFWCMSLGELYGSSTESRMARDVTEMVEWIRGAGNRPRSIDEAFFQQDRLLTLRMRISAAYKALHAILMQHGCQDFITGRSAEVMTFFNDRIDIHHIFPQKWCKEHSIDPGVFNSIVNKTPLSKLSNIAIGGDAPSVYLRRIEQQQRLSSQALDAILRTHLIEPEHLRSDDFDAFFEARRRALIPLVSAAMGKAVIEEKDLSDPETEVPLEPEEEIEEELAEAI